MQGWLVGRRLVTHVLLSLKRQRAWGGEAAAVVLATQEFVANGGGRPPGRRRQSAGAGSVMEPPDRAAEVVPGGRPDTGRSVSGPTQLVGPGIVPMPSIAFVNSIA